MKSKESEYRDLFLAEALENFEELNKLFIVLEKDHADKKAIDSIFRIIHTLKGNSMAMGFEAISSLSHVMEDLIGAIVNGQITMNKDLFDSLFRANDKLGELIQSITSGKKVSYLGIKTKLSVLLKNALGATGEDTGKKEAITDSDKEGDSPEALGEEGVTEAVAQDNDQNDGADGIKFADIIQIPVRKMDELMNLVGQLLIEKDRLISVHSNNGRNSAEFDGLQRISSNLQYSMMKARMVQMGFLFNKFYRIVRDAAALEGKNVDLVLKGVDIEIDRNILKIMSDSLIHLVRNAVSHGIESGDYRKKIKKNEVGIIRLSARSEKDNVVIEVADDGNGIDAARMRQRLVEKGMVSREKAQTLAESDVISYIFEPGFSNATKVTEISGRGVGMDVVKKAAESIGGQVKVNTELGKGTTISLLLPSSMALKGALLFELEGQTYGVALSYTESVMSLKKQDIHKIGGGLMATFQDQTISMVFLQDLVSLTDLSDVRDAGTFHKTFDSTDAKAILDIIVVRYADRLFGIVVDKMLQQKEIIEKTLPKPLEDAKIISGTTILGDGHVCPIIDVPAITDILYKSLIEESITN